MSGTEVFDRAAALLPRQIRAEALFLPERERASAEEIRLRCGAGACIRWAEGERRLGSAVGAEELAETLERATKSSLYTAEESLRGGWYTAEGGFRLGVCGSVSLRDGRIAGYRSVSSLCIRIPHAVSCVSDELFSLLLDRSVIVFSGPGGGKTTFLRELVRRVSEAGRQVALVDERGELAALSGGRPSYDVGCRTDLLEGCPKGCAAEILLRSMSPQVLAMDELSAADVPALRAGVTAGVRLLATAHAARRDELMRRGLPLELFDYSVQITGLGGRRSYRAEALPC